MSVGGANGGVRKRTFSVEPNGLGMSEENGELMVKRAKDVEVEDGKR